MKKHKDDIDKKLRAMERALRKDPGWYEPKPLPPLLNPQFVAISTTGYAQSSHSHTINPNAYTINHTFDPTRSVGDYATSSTLTFQSNTTNP